MPLQFSIKKLPVGIDIEKPVEKLGRISHRFLNEEEFNDSMGDLRKLCIYWSGKEAIFKLNGKVGLNFKNDIRIHPFTLHKRDVVKSEFFYRRKTWRELRSTTRKSMDISLLIASDYSLVG
jgi:phosphopantetheinyl transferase